ncbi:MAG TPA: cytochrome c family protein [Caulobacteraceae bacterium]|nr:cytochrome c family protein [Caulobacteraceae bacterium]
MNGARITNRTQAATRLPTVLILIVAAAAAVTAACGPSGGGAPVKTAAQLTAELPAPYNGGDVAAGKLVFLQCAACHTATKDGANMVGPNLYGLFGSKAGTRRADFAYTDELKATGWTWDAATLDRWIEDPRAVLPKTKMVFVGLKNPKDRVNLIAYLKVAASGGPS